ncbi:carboxymuconolactone decarboxylase family protein [Hankyongella ginsenosidimutans]|uniref:carboxymuconolactone decarboxylase family protein n=1 Tax=Hankyongella ginsenosidimutans TaxID=1763828 RepID=UPI001CA340AD|nr:carboxymuconolactone decarboxylase family protein [Hankyongella ginsenosidimutans]
MFGFVPNLHKILAESPAAHEAYSTLYKLATEKTNLTPVEVQVVMMTSNYHNRCHYCMAGHSMIMTMLKAPQDIITALREGKPLADAKLEALRVLPANCWSNTVTWGPGTKRFSGCRLHQGPGA